MRRRSGRRKGVATVRRSILSALKCGALALLLMPLAAAGPAPQAQVKLWRLDCGRFSFANIDFFSDTHAYLGRSGETVGSCYLIRHGDQYMLWDTGLDRSALGRPMSGAEKASYTLAVAIVDQLKQLGVGPEQISVIGISHYHSDHTGQAAEFPQAKLLIGDRDLEIAKTRPDLAAKLAPWISGKSAVEGVRGDKDVFGDGSVVMLDLPGHTPGHHGLLVKLDHTGWVMLSGDVALYRESLDNDSVPTFAADRAQSLASLDRFRRMAANLGAITIIQHDPGDVAKLPAFPAGAE